MANSWAISSTANFSLYKYKRETGGTGYDKDVLLIFQLVFSYML